MQQVEEEAPALTTSTSTRRNTKSTPELDESLRPCEHDSDNDISCSDISGCTPIPLSSSCARTGLPANTNSRLLEYMSITITKSESTISSSKSRKRKIDQSSLIKPTENDIVLGRGGHSNNHPGNKHFREKALELRPVYEACESKEEKFRISQRLVECMEAENRRFLRKNSDGQWYEVEGNDVRKKASQALRERVRLSESLPAEYDF